MPNALAKPVAHNSSRFVNATSPGYRSHRIDDEHRLVYRVDGDSLAIVQARYHYRGARVLVIGLILVFPRQRRTRTISGSGHRRVALVPFVIELSLSGLVIV